MPKMSQKTYVASNGQNCPNCKLSLVQLEASTTRSNELRDTLECTACLTRFERIYKLQGYKLL